jgi:hypothetical protein
MKKLKPLVLGLNNKEIKMIGITIISILIWGFFIHIVSGEVEMSASVPENPCNKCLEVCNNLK